MGTEIKTPESGESSLRNRKRKENVSVKNSSKTEDEEDDLKEVEQPLEEDLKAEQPTRDQPIVAAANFRLRLEFDPMSIVLLTLALITRFYRLSEPRNVV